MILQSKWGLEHVCYWYRHPYLSWSLLQGSLPLRQCLKSQAVDFLAVIQLLLASLSTWLSPADNTKYSRRVHQLAIMRSVNPQINGSAIFLRRCLTSDRFYCRSRFCGYGQSCGTLGQQRSSDPTAFIKIWSRIADHMCFMLSMKERVTWALHPRSDTSVAKVSALLQGSIKPSFISVRNWHRWCEMSYFRLAEFLTGVARNSAYNPHLPIAAAFAHLCSRFVCVGLFWLMSIFLPCMSAKLICAIGDFFRGDTYFGTSTFTLHETYSPWYVWENC